MAKQQRAGFGPEGEKDEMPTAKINKQSLQHASRLFSYLGPHKWKFFVGLIFLGLTAATAIIFPGMLGKLMGLIGDNKSGTPSFSDAAKYNNVYLTNEQSSRLMHAANHVGLLLIVLFAFQAVFSYARVWFFL